MLLINVPQCTEVSCNQQLKGRGRGGADGLIEQAWGGGEISILLLTKTRKSVAYFLATFDKFWRIFLSAIAKGYKFWPIFLLTLRESL